MNKAKAEAKQCLIHYEQICHPEQSRGMDACLEHLILIDSDFKDIDPICHAESLIQSAFGFHKKETSMFPGNLSRMLIPFAKYFSRKDAKVCKEE